jgi:phosphoribosylglycinamide formyltransferase-1
MVKLIGLKKVNTAVFISGTGSNLKSLIKFSLLKKSPIKINLIISSNIKAKGLQYAKLHKIKKKIITLKIHLFQKKFYSKT